MKSLLALIALAIVGYWLYTYYQENPDSLPQIRRTTAASVPIPSPTTPTPKPVQPPLDSIPVVKGPTLTHARVKDFSATSVLFVCDQGLMEVSYDRLPPGFAAYYIPRVPAPTPVPSPTPTPTPGPTSVPTKKLFVEHSSRSSEDDANAIANYNRDIQRLQDRMAADQVIIDHYHSGSSFDKDTPSENDYNSAQSDYNKAQQQLADRIGQGP